MIESLQVPTSFFDHLKSTAVPESMARVFPNSPILVDTTKAAFQFGLRPQQIEAIKQVLIKGSEKWRHSTRNW